MLNKVFCLLGLTLLIGCGRPEEKPAPDQKVNPAGDAAVVSPYSQGDVIGNGDEKDVLQRQLRSLEELGTLHPCDQTDYDKLRQMVPDVRV